MKRKLTLKYVSLFTMVLCAAFMMASCRKFIEVPPPINSIVTSQVFADSADATAAINGIYINMINRAGSLNIANSGVSVFGSLSADETYYSLNVASYNEFYINAITVTNANNASLWAKAYTYIYQANACIEGVANSTTLSTTLKNRITGEAKFLRSFMYFYLVNLYGRVPLALTTDYKVTDILPRAAVADIYTQINADLTAAQALLGNDPVPINKVRVNRFSVAAFFARVQLYQQQWAAAEASATSVINAAYKLEPNLNNVFLNGNQEQIWQMTPIAAGDETTEGQLYIPSSATTVPQFVVTSSLLNTFEANDQRQALWLNTSTVAGTKYVYPYKYKLGFDNSTTPKEAYSMLRLGEQYLIRAEARAQQNNLAGAIADINAIRSRAGLPNATAINQTAVLAAVQHERQTELFCEWGQRWLDLKRTNTIDAVLSVGKTGWQPAAALFPVPYTQIQLNPFLTQNPGY
ncbi:MAG: RagB/SusD family nutrient uptake outer membrane protein [Bacteroidota bacterium]|nr:RagB/SusD family nutrient uptake outer membrane protein [Bacteroidota bacterium]